MSPVGSTQEAAGTLLGFQQQHQQQQQQPVVDLADSLSQFHRQEQQQVRNPYTEWHRQQEEKRRQSQQQSRNDLGNGIGAFISFGQEGSNEVEIPLGQEDSSSSINSTHQDQQQEEEEDELENSDFDDDEEEDDDNNTSSLQQYAAKLQQEGSDAFGDIAEEDAAMIDNALKNKKGYSNSKDATFKYFEQIITKHGNDQIKEWRYHERF